MIVSKETNNCKYRIKSLQRIKILAKNIFIFIIVNINLFSLTLGT